MGWSDLKITILVTTAQTLLPNKVLFTGFREMCLFWGGWGAPVNPQHLRWVTFLSEPQGFYLYNGANTNSHLKGQLWGLTKPKECMVQLQCLGNPQSEWLPFLADGFFPSELGSSASLFLPFPHFSAHMSLDNFPILLCFLPVSFGASHLCPLRLGFLICHMG